MRKTSGRVRFGGSVAYVPQVSTDVIVFVISVQVIHPLFVFPQRPWIRNASVRENIMFGLPEDTSRYHPQSQYSNHELMNDSHFPGFQR